MYIYVQAQDGAPLMPTQRTGKVRRMLRDGRAVIASHTPFAIRLTYDTTHYTQPVSLGVDAGSKHIGLSAKGWQNWNKRTKELDGQSDYICVGTFGLYWSSSPNGMDLARNVLFNNGYVNPQYDNDRLLGFSVRLCKTPNN